MINVIYPAYDPSMTISDLHEDGVDSTEWLTEDMYNIEGIEEIVFEDNEVYITYLYAQNQNIDDIIEQYLLVLSEGSQEEKRYLYGMIKNWKQYKTITNTPYICMTKDVFKRILKIKKEIR